MAPICLPKSSKSNPDSRNGIAGTVTGQKFVLPYPQCVILASVSGCFENNNNNCCETKMPFIKNGPYINNLATLLLGH